MRKAKQPSIGALLTEDPLLFKYRSKESAFRLLEDNTLWLSSRRFFNDPFDCYPSFEEPTSGDLFEFAKTVVLDYVPAHLPPQSQMTRQQIEAQKKPLGEKIDHQLRELKKGNAFEVIREGIVETIDSYGICSFTANLHSILMWSHYAENHKGVAFGFSLKTLNGSGRKVRKVEYPEKRGNIKISLNSKEIQNEKFEIVNNAFLKKSPDWKYEEEYRLIEKDAANTAIPIPLGALKLIVFGVEADVETKGKILQEVRMGNLSVQLLQAKLSQSLYRLDFEELTLRGD